MTKPTAEPPAKFKVGQVVALKRSEKFACFKILEAEYFSDHNEWFYRWNRKNWAAESMLRELTPQETHND